MRASIPCSNGALASPASSPSASGSGYGLYGVAIVGFFLGLATGFGGAVGTTVIVCLVVGSIVLAPAIVFGYGVKAAEREDRELGR